MNLTIEQRNLLKSGQYGLDDVQIDELLNLYTDFDTLMNRINTFQQQHESDNYNSDQLFDFLINNNNEYDELASYLDNLTLNTDTYDSDVSGEDNVGGRRRWKTRRRRNRNRKRITKRKRNRKRVTKRKRNRNRNRNRTMRGGRGFTISEDLNPIAYKEDEYDQMNNMLNYNPSN